MSPLDWTPRRMRLVQALIVFVLAFLIAPLVRAQTIQYSATANGTYAPLDGATNVPTKVNIRVLPCPSVIPWNFTLDTQPLGAVEAECPIEAGGDGAIQTLSVGSHTLTANALTARFTVGSATTPDTGTATVSWTAPTQNDDGSAYTNPAGYTVSYGKTPAAADSKVVLSNPAARTTLISGLDAATWYFSVAAFNSAGINSVQSAIVGKVVASTPAPVNCTVSAWMSGTPSGWLPQVCATGTQTQTTPQTRVVVIPAANGGAACPALTQTLTETRPCTVPPVCGPQPAAESRQSDCTPPLVGAWTQSRTYASVAAPACWQAGAWLPAQAPAGICAAPSPLLTAGPLAYSSAATSMTAVGYVAAGLPCGPDVKTVAGVKYCRIVRAQTDMVNFSADLKLIDLWSRAQ